VTFEDFEARAHEMFESIPPEFRDGVDGLVVEPSVQPHPELPDIYTLGECLTEFYPSDYGGPGEVRSFVVLYHGSFRRLAERSDEWDWEGELWETITHEVKHHLESLASEDALEVEDWVMDQNFARREGQTFDPGFFRDGTPLEPGMFEVDGDIFVEREIDANETAEGALTLPWKDGDFRVVLPRPLGDVHFVALDGIDDEADGDVVLVLSRRRSMWESLRTALGGGRKVEHSRARAERIR